ncbi:disease resistance family protein / LRR family protein [Prunus dulcis]|uniref:Disease resistance family protein / LRR family protein n=1 Tax=Prunus dulcis TaxID=3755 RepID=A0A5H2XGH1_PRUDU|nr:disease resistance family protein / LRR family protein [Prunus dulcis]
MAGDGRCLKLFLALSIVFLQNVKGGGKAGHSHNHSHSLRDAKVTVRCIERERQALLAFKRGLVDKFNLLSTWGSEAEKQDCCRWEGVYCSNQTGHVIQLHLGYSLPDEIKSQLAPALSSLTDLDLSGNFNESQIPEFIGSLTNLRNLRLFSCNLVGQIPSSFGNLTQLQYLDLSDNYQLQPENLNWLASLSSLTDLGLASIDFSEGQIPDFIGSLTNLRNLRLSSCNLVGLIPSSFGNLTQLQHLDLADNQLQPENLNWLPALSSLTYLDLAFIDFNGSQIPDFIGSLTNLRNLSLSFCNLVGQIPSSFGNLTQLQHLDLRDNYQLQPENLNWLPVPSSLTYLGLSGANLSTVLDLSLTNFNGSQFPDFIGSLTNLRNLRLSSCNLVGRILSSFGNLKQLQNLDLSGNQLQPENLNWLPALSSLTDLDLGGNFNGSQIPDFIGSLTNLRYLSLSFCDLVGQIPSSFGNLTQLRNLDLSNNQLQLENLNWLPALSSLKNLDLSRNNLSLPSPPTPILSTTLYRTNSSTSLAFVYLSDNHLTSSIFLWFSNYSTSLVLLDLSNNNLSGFIPDFIGNMSSLADLDLSNNSLTGFIPDFIGNMSSLGYLDLSDNQIEGANPNSFARLCNLRVLGLQRNHLSGQLSQLLPRCAQNSLVHLDLSENVLKGH